MKKTKIEWCDSTWNPVTGCFHECEYCYARKIAERFGGASETHVNETVGRECQWCTEAEGKIHCLDIPIYNYDMGRNAPYPFEFDPTFHRYLLDKPQHWKKPRNIFVCSMADLFGEWVPDSWIEEVFAACEKAPQHRYLFLTKNPQRYIDLARAGKLPANDNMWYGTTLEKPDQDAFWSKELHTFISIEPILEPFEAGADGIAEKTEWAILGAETGYRNGKIKPERKWIDPIVDALRANGKPVFMKDSLLNIWGDTLITEFPWKD